MLMRDLVLFSPDALLLSLCVAATLDELFGAQSAGTSPALWPHAPALRVGAGCPSPFAACSWLCMHLSGDTGGDADALFGTNATVQHRANAQADDVGTSPVVSGDPLQRKYVAWAAVLLAAC